MTEHDVGCGLQYGRQNAKVRQQIFGQISQEVYSEKNHWMARIEDYLCKSCSKAFGQMLYAK